ncbi:cyclohexanone monooxygenase [Blastomyces dermatitidis ER-3]|uniref:Cyclohexanone monooxygenase n=1 Tax=Ajellomyces dermatitidis (strain ER-3 / ATCC MYA-2586) TaxID=559297 RepID=A0ABP2EX10_AJEDR|nr:cyclohexanone monooxygenase [Blastomyces dermatitidis ER-3]EEQ86985.1 cyclohexanone monooxygenase [Blastomyces dermatitidis ER-3]EQL33303.1 hypothetical protein BDFG_04735 [Blastomyces dermatitidis ATCC 26199]
MGDFRGTLCHTAAWPVDLDVRDKRVGLIGTGGDGPVSASHRAKINRDYDAIMAQVQNSLFGCGFEESTRAYESVPEAEREAIFEQLWEHGNGFHFMFGGFSDISTNPVANEAACTFIRKKIGEIVHGPEKARILMPTDRYARRPLCDSGYCEQFNRVNVHIVDVGAGNPISHFAERGLVTQDGTEYELDVVMFATGFDAVDGSYTRLQIRGVGGKTLQEHWAKGGPTSYLGISVPNFPNLFVIAGPQAELSRKVAAAAGTGGGSAGTVTAMAESEKMWMQTFQKIAEGSLFSGTASWLFGSNVSGTKSGVRFYLAGLRSYIQVLKMVAEKDFRGFKSLVKGSSGRM